jgi:dystroglycan 1
VHAAPALPYNVEFRMTLSKTTLDEVEVSPAKKRRLMERLGQLFGDPDARNVVLAGLRPPPYQHVISGPSPSLEVSWYNKSLPRDICAEKEVAALRRMLVSEEAQGHGHSTLPQASLGGRVAEIMKPEFPVLRVAMVPTGLCQGELTFVHAPLPPEPPSDDDLAAFGTSASSDEYLITYIVPAVVIAAMLLLAGLVACALYRRNRRGKLAVGESGPGTPGFRTRGIPVIFQDELDEKAVEPVAKSPVIMKNEKPPLPPPEYPQQIPSSGATPHATPPMHPHRQPTAEDPLLSEEPEASPYQPPPPFTSNRDTGRQNRPKPTPTYRKPPPYVPP